MANFKPFKNYMLILAELLVAKHSMSGPFLDVGCGNGEVSLHFAKKGWRGKAVDMSAEAIEVARKTLSEYKEYVSVEHTDLSCTNGKYNTIFLYEILEHIKDDEQFLEIIKARAHQDACFIMAIPTFKKEWRWDDDYYGHYRRYEIPEFRQLLMKKGFEVLDIWDSTFPCFWLLRCLATNIVSRKGMMAQSQERATEKSGIRGFWKEGKVMGMFVNMFEKIVWWQLVYFIQLKFRRQVRGCECIVAAKYTGKNP